MEEEKQLKKDRYCLRCEYVIECKGKPQGVTMCINFKERRSNNEKMLR